MSEVSELPAIDGYSLSNQIHTKEQIKVFCSEYASQLKWDGNARALLYAISGLETSFGSNNVPRFEYSYGRSSIAYRKSSLLQDGFKKYGDLCAMSYGAHQILWVVASELGYPLNTSPLALWDSRISLPYVVKYINRCISSGAKTVLQIGMVYNGGMGALRSKDGPAVLYGVKLNKLYDSILAGNA